MISVATTSYSTGLLEWEGAWDGDSLHNAQPVAWFGRAYWGA